MTWVRGEITFFGVRKRCKEVLRPSKRIRRKLFEPLLNSNRCWNTDFRSTTGSIGHGCMVRQADSMLRQPLT